MARTLIHIGMPRTASTFFQQRFFPEIEGFQFFGVDTTHYSDAFQRLLYQDDSLFDEAEFEKTAAGIRSRDAILSNELFTGQSLYLNATNRSRTARRLRHFFPEAEIILVLRNQVSLLQSLYAIGIYSGNTCSPQDFIRFTDEPSTVENPRYPTFSPTESTETYKYTALVELYQSLFSKIHLFLFEDFTVNPSVFANRLCEGLDIANVEIKDTDSIVNRSLSARQLTYTRSINRLKPILYRSRAGKKIFNKSLQTIEHRAGGKKVFQIPKNLRIKLAETYAKDNLKLLQLAPELHGATFQKYYLNSNNT